MRTDKRTDNGKTSQTPEVLAFRDGTHRHATVVTDGTRHKSFTLAGAKDHRTIGEAIAYLECKGYHIITDEWV